jgi:hypothetical protein
MESPVDGRAQVAAARQLKDPLIEERLMVRYSMQARNFKA